MSNRWQDHADFRRVKHEPRGNNNRKEARMKTALRHCDIDHLSEGDLTDDDIVEILGLPEYDDE